MILNSIYIFLIIENTMQTFILICLKHELNIRFKGNKNRNILDNDGINDYNIPF